MRGTGSNVYVASLSKALAALGHDVHVLCQDRDAEQLAWVDRVGTWKRGRLRVDSAGAGDGEGQGRGAVTAYLPEIGGLLPVYVEDRYEGFRVKEFPELDDSELERYLAANVAAVGDVLDLAGHPDAAVSNHLVMGPAILARAGLEFAAKIHGSALSYTVRPHPERFLPLASEGLAGARAVLVGSTDTARRLWETMRDPDLRARTRLAPPGVDTRAFAPLQHAAAPERLAELGEAIAESPAGGFGRAPERAVEGIEWFARSDGPRVVFVGKLIASKGPDLLAAAWPLVVSAHPKARLLIVGFGGYQAALEELLAALGAGDLGAARAVARRGREPGGRHGGRLKILEAFLQRADSDYVAAARAAAGTIRLTGRLEHDEVARLISATDAMLVPSTFPEAFGMVAAEAAAAGVLPISAAHSGLAEVTAELAAAVPEIEPLLSFDVDEWAVEAIADRLIRWLALPEDRRASIGRELASAARSSWSWNRVARGVIAAAAGELDALPRATQ